MKISRKVVKSEEIKSWYKKNKKASHYLLAAFFIGAVLGKFIIMLAFIGIGAYAVYTIFKKREVKSYDKRSF
jgi:predicted negative regulator of RcsB-dependent stress response